MRRWIMHVDMDASFCVCRTERRPRAPGQACHRLRKEPPERRCDRLLRSPRLGVHSAMPLSQAKRLCPHGCFVAPRFEAYREASDAIHQVMLHYADAYEPISLDEAFLDISGMGSRSPTLGSIGRAIKEEIRCAVHLTASVGIAPNKFLAKMASDMNKPDGLCIIPYGRERGSPRSPSRAPSLGRGQCHGEKTPGRRISHHRRHPRGGAGKTLRPSGQAGTPAESISPLALTKHAHHLFPAGEIHRR